MSWNVNVIILYVQGDINSNLLISQYVLLHWIKIMHINKSFTFFYCDVLNIFQLSKLLLWKRLGMRDALTFFPEIKCLHL